MKLTKTQCSKLKPKSKAYKIFDGGGLFLEIMPSGSKIWRVKYYFLNKEKRMTLGKYPVLTLLEARSRLLEVKKLLNNGVDPSQFEQDAKLKARQEADSSFESVALEWHASQIENWSERHADDIMVRLKANVFLFIGHRPINQISTLEMLELVRHIEKRGALEVAKRVRQYCSQIFRYGMCTCKCDSDPASVITGAMKKRKKGHFAAIESDDLPKFIEDLNANSYKLRPRTRRAMVFSLLTFARPGEIRQARWQDIYFSDSQWRIPAEFMKMDKDHIVPLSNQAIDILQEQYKETGTWDTPWVFPNAVRKHKPMSDGTVNMALKRLGYHKRMTAHGFRALARTAIREKLKYYPDAIEAQLAHKPMGALGAAYDRAKFLDERTKMMQDWADYIGYLDATN